MHGPEELASAERRRAGPDALERRLRAVPGLVVRPAEPLARHTTFRIGGPAQLFVEASGEESLCAALAVARESGSPLLVVGLGSNVLFPDAGFAGVVLRLSGGLRRLKIDGERVEAGAALALAQVARRTAERGLVGLEALAGFPSTVGGAVYMNAGCYGTEICDLLESATVVDAEGRRRRVGPADLDPGYRRTALQGSGSIVTGAVLRLRRGDSEAALRRIEEVNRQRRASLPSGRPNAGSIFRNPPDDHAGRLIDLCGLKGLRRGGAQISPKHGNVIVNLGGGTAAQVLELMLEAHRSVKERFGVELQPEVVLAGELRVAWEQGVGSRRAGLGGADRILPAP